MASVRNCAAGRDTKASRGSEASAPGLSSSVFADMPTLRPESTPVATLWGTSTARVSSISMAIAILSMDASRSRATAPSALPKAYAGRASTTKSIDLNAETGRSCIRYCTTSAHTAGTCAQGLSESNFLRWAVTRVWILCSSLSTASTPMARLPRIFLSKTRADQASQPESGQASQSESSGAGHHSESGISPAAAALMRVTRLAKALN